MNMKKLLTYQFCGAVICRKVILDEEDLLNALRVIVEEPQKYKLIELTNIEE